jgi:hypothetical protein
MLKIYAKTSLWPYIGLKKLTKRMDSASDRQPLLIFLQQKMAVSFSPRPYHHKGKYKTAHRASKNKSLNITPPRNVICLHYTTNI